MAGSVAHHVDLATRFPPSFENNPFTYGAALFSLIFVSAISLAILAGWLLESRHRREIDRKVHNRLAGQQRPFMSPVDLHRFIVSGFLLTIVFGALPDVVVLLAWGEATDATMEMLFGLDRIFDALTLVPFTWAVLLIAWAGSAVDHVLAVEPLSIRFRPSWFMVRRNLRMAGLVALLAAGVTYAKSVA